MKNDNAVEHNNQTASEQTSSPDESHALHKVRDPVCGMVILPDKAHSSISAPPAVRANLKPIPIITLPKMPVNITITTTTMKSALIR